MIITWHCAFAQKNYVLNPRTAMGKILQCFSFLLSKNLALKFVYIYALASENFHSNFRRCRSYGVWWSASLQLATRPFLAKSGSFFQLFCQNRSWWTLRRPCTRDSRKIMGLQWSKNSESHYRCTGASSTFVR